MRALLFTLLLANSAAFGQAAMQIQGQVLQKANKKPVVFGTIVVPETGQKAFIEDKGAFSLNFPQEGTYTIFIKSPGMKPLQQKVNISSGKKLTLYLDLVTVQGDTVVLTADRDVQKISRYTLTGEEMKSIPAAFGDPVSALTSLPGIIRTNGLVGPLVIRGAPPSASIYLIDEIPVFYPLHFGGLHTVIPANLMNEIDVFSSAFPAQYGNGYGGLITINTVDEVKDLSGFADVSLGWTSALVKDRLPQKDKKNSGYWIVGGRRSYYELANPLIKLLTGSGLDEVPQYTDYQLKSKYFLNQNNALTLFFFGGWDQFKFIDREAQQRERAAEGADPLLNGIQFESRSQFHNQALTYTFRPSKFFKNRLIVFSALNETFFFVDNPSQAAFILNLNVSSKPNIFGVKNKAELEYWRDIAELRFGGSAIHYRFNSQGQTLVPKQQIVLFDIGDNSLFEVVPLDEAPRNWAYSGYLENKFTFLGFTMVPGIRAEYLDLNRQTIVNARGMASYDFPTRTTVSVAGGQYSAFLQTNPNWFTNQPQVGSADYLRAQESIHRSVGLEQKVSLFTLRVEGFYNTYTKLVEPDPHTTESGEERQARNSGQQKNKGIEVLFRKDVRKKSSDFFGWVSYTYLEAKQKTGLASDPLGDLFVNSPFEQVHSVKLVAGYILGRNTFSTRFEYYTSFPYTPIVSGSGPDSLGRYTPVASNDRNSARFGPTMRLDIRFDRQTNYKWGYIKWYIEILNVTNFQPKNSEVWRYDQPYQAGVNPKVQSEDNLPFFPNFGVEAKF